MKPKYLLPSGSGTTSWPMGMVIVTSSTPETLRAASSPPTDSSTPARGMGIIMTPVALSFTRIGLDAQSQAVPKNQPLEADPSSDPECPGAQPANGARPHFDDPRTLVIEPQFGMNGTVLQPQGRDGLDRGIHDPAL